VRDEERGRDSLQQGVGLDRGDELFKISLLGLGNFKAEIGAGAALAPVIIFFEDKREQSEPVIEVFCCRLRRHELSAAARERRGIALVRRMRAEPSGDRTEFFKKTGRHGAGRARETRADNGIERSLQD